jgi:hypothetical protein
VVAIHTMFRSLLPLALLVALVTPDVSRSADNGTLLKIQEEVWALPLVHPTIAYVVRPVGSGRGGRVGGKPNNNCNPDKLVEATGEFGRTARTPMLWIYITNDTYFGPPLPERMYNAYTAAGGNAEYHLMPPFGNEGHIFIDSPDSIPQWSPLVSQFLDKHR